MPDARLSKRLTLRALQSLSECAHFPPCQLWNSRTYLLPETITTHSVYVRTAPWFPTRGPPCPPPAELAWLGRSLFPAETPSPPCGRRRYRRQDFRSVGPGPPACRPPRYPRPPPRQARRT